MPQFSANPPLEGKIAAVTGAGSGIGRASALALSAAGATVVVSDVVLEKAEETAHQITRAGGQAIALQADVTQTDQVEEMVALSVRKFGRLDCAHNNAGLFEASAEVNLLHKQTEEVWLRTIDVNLNGVWRCMKAELPVMVEGGGGAIVNTSSIFGLVGSPGVSAYVASKHGVAGLTRAAALEYGRYNIRVNAVCPGFTRTPMVDPVFANERLLKSWLGMQSMRRPGEPEEIAAVVVWLCSDAASFVTGSMLSADGGYTAR
ncbi:MAG: SDR family oxidoreductase [Caldilineaceae bacterium]|nr:SDR family oxidoreductase [Caldilineaceae bacterium]